MILLPLMLLLFLCRFFCSGRFGWTRDHVNQAKAISSWYLNLPTWSNGYL